MQYPVQYVPQSRDDLCWAASTAMMVNYNTGSSKKDTDIEAESAYIGGNGVSEAELNNVARSFDMHEVTVDSCKTMTDWYDLLTSSGPLMVAIGRQGGEHIIVVYGVEPTSETDGDIYVCDPWHGNGAVALGEFQNRYEASNGRWSHTTYGF
jgi:ABC-type bacteriocin/lantibiotic exporter with double-glycine peptidase domain